MELKGRITTQVFDKIKAELPPSPARARFNQDKQSTKGTVINMSTSYYVVGMRPPDEKFEAMKAIWDACQKADVEVPNEVLIFFDDHEPDVKGIEVDLPITEGSGEYRNWFTLSVSDIPNNITEIRFVISE